VTILDELGSLEHNELVGDELWLARLRLPRIAAAATPGQFLQIRVGGGPAPLLRLPLSVAGADPDTGCVEVVYARVGPKTTDFACSRPGARLSCLGPLGNGFQSSGGTVRAALLVGGGVGTPPLLFLGRRLLEAGWTVTLLAGARTAGKHLPAALLAAAGTRCRQATDDGSLGHSGLVTDLLAEELAGQPRAVVFACGPAPMLKAVARRCQTGGVPCQVSLEEYMACGIGICMGCVVPVLPDHGPTDYGRYQRVCLRGPVFDAAAVDWGSHG